ncbi:MAG: hypothetical protein GXY48_08090 [Methanomicrobiales archaeon]|nr:hypothetical protein [Methanomicrobiales archaeon]
MAGNEVEIPVEINATAFYGGPIGQVPYIPGVQDTIPAGIPVTKRCICVEPANCRISSSSPVVDGKDSIPGQIIRYFNE